MNDEHAYCPKCGSEDTDTLMWKGEPFGDSYYETRLKFCNECDHDWFTEWREWTDEDLENQIVGSAQIDYSVPFWEDEP